MQSSLSKKKKKKTKKKSKKKARGSDAQEDGATEGDEDTLTVDEFRNLVADLRNEDETVHTIFFPAALREKHKSSLGLDYTARMHHNGALPWVEAVAKGSMADEAPKQKRMGDCRR